MSTNTAFKTKNSYVDYNKGDLNTTYSSKGPDEDGMGTLLESFPTPEMTPSGRSSLARTVKDLFGRLEQLGWDLSSASFSMSKYKENLRKLASGRSGSTIEAQEDLGFDMSINHSTESLEVSFSGVPPYPARDFLRKSGFQYNRDTYSWSLHFSAMDGETEDMIRSKLSELIS